MTITTSPSPKVRKGRPRDERIDREVTSAALLVLADTGFSGFSVAEVAARAGVGIGTVSRVLSGSQQVSQRTRARVLAAVEELGYSPVR